MPGNSAKRSSSFSPLSSAGRLRFKSQSIQRSDLRAFHHSQVPVIPAKRSSSFSPASSAGRLCFKSQSIQRSDLRASFKSQAIQRSDLRAFHHSQVPVDYASNAGQFSEAIFELFTLL
jgi:hypothetical protein